MEEASGRLSETTSGPASPEVARELRTVEEASALGERSVEVATRGSGHPPPPPPPVHVHVQVWEPSAELELECSTSATRPTLPAASRGSSSRRPSGSTSGSTSSSVGFVCSRNPSAASLGEPSSSSAEDSQLRGLRNASSALGSSWQRATGRRASSASPPSVRPGSSDSSRRSVPSLSSRRSARHSHREPGPQSESSEGAAARRVPRGTDPDRGATATQLGGTGGLSSPIAMVPTSLCCDSVEGQNLFATPEPTAPSLSHRSCRASFGPRDLARGPFAPSLSARSLSGEVPKTRADAAAERRRPTPGARRRPSHSVEVEKSLSLMRRTSLAFSATHALQTTIKRRSHAGPGEPSTPQRAPKSPAAGNRAAEAMTQGGGFGDRSSGLGEPSGPAASPQPAPEASHEAVEAAPDTPRPEIALETIAQHLRPCSVSLLLITAALGPYDCFEFGFHLLDWSDQPRSLGLLLLLRYAACVPVCLAAVVVVHVQLRHGLRDKAHMQILGCGLMLVGAVCFTMLVIAAPNREPRPMWATAMLVVHQWFMYTVLALEPVPQAVLTFVMSAVGGFLVWWSQIKELDDSADTTDYASSVTSLVFWSLIFHALGLRHTLRRRAGLLRHAQHRQRSMVCAEHIMEEVEACKRLLENV